VTSLSTFGTCLWRVCQSCKHAPTGWSFVNQQDHSCFL
jgi:hypothetical protein